VDSLRRVLRPDAGSPVVQVREAQRLLDAPRHLAGRRIGVGETGGLAALADAVGRALAAAGAVVAVLHHPDESVQASEANAFDAEAFVSLAVRETSGCATAFYTARGFASIGGRRLAELLQAEIDDDVFPCADDPNGMQLPILRETRMAAVVCELGPPQTVVERTGELATGIARALTRWALGPPDTLSTSD
jgi:hypothetical protein